jgi:hypothetical protein
MSVHRSRSTRLAPKVNLPSAHFFYAFAVFVRLSLDTFLEVAGILRTFFFDLNFVAGDCASPPELERSATAFYTICIIMFPVATYEGHGPRRDS